MGDTEIVGDAGDRIFANSSCVLVGFEFLFTKPEEFRFEEFKNVTGWKKKNRFRNSCGTKNKHSDYHLHLHWRIGPPHSVFLQLEFGIGYKAPDDGESEPFAEDFLKWLRQFIIAKELTIETYANFDFAVDPSRKLSFPLPMKAPVGPGNVEAEIDGISFKVSPPVQGIEKIWVTQGKQEINIHVHAKKIMAVDSIAPRHEIDETSKVLESLFERRELP